jgi:hypothetical protein
MLEAASLPTGARLAKDAFDQNVILFNDPWSCSYFSEKNPAIIVSELPFGEQLPTA